MCTISDHRIRTAVTAAGDKARAGDRHCSVTDWRICKIRAASSYNVVYDCPAPSGDRLTVNRCESDTRPASCVSSRYRSQNQSAMPLDDLQQYGRDSASSSDSGQSDDDANCSQPKADGNATDSESGGDGDQAQQSYEQSENGRYDSSEHTPAQKSKRAPFTQHSADHLPDLVHESDDEDCAEASDEETL